MRGGRVLLWALFGLVVLAFSLMEGSAGESPVSRPKARSSGLPKKPVISAKKDDDAAEEDEEDEQEEVVSEEDDEEEQEEEEDMDEEDDEDDEGRISFVDSTRVKTGRDLQSGNHFFTRILLATRKQVVNSSAFRFLAEGKTFETVAGMLAWRFAMALAKDPANVRRGRLLFTMYLTMYLTYLLYVRGAALRNNDKRTLTVEVGAGAVVAIRSMLKKMNKDGGLGGLGGAAGIADLFKAQPKKMTFRKYDLEQVKQSFQRFTLWMAIMTYMHFRMKNVSFIMYWGMLGPIMIMREPLFQVYVLGMDETGIRERPFGPKEVPEEEGANADNNAAAGGEGGEGGGSGEAPEVTVEVEVEGGEAEEEDLGAEEDEDVVEEDLGEEEGEEMDGGDSDVEDEDVKEGKEEEALTHPAAKKRRTADEEERLAADAAIAEGPGAPRHGGDKPEGFHVEQQDEDVHPPEPSEHDKAMTPDHFHVKKQRKDIRPDAPPVTQPGKVVVCPQKEDQSAKEVKAPAASPST